MEYLYECIPMYVTCRKDRKVFEAYQLEAKAARNKRDKEEIKALRNEVRIES